MLIPGMCSAYCMLSVPAQGLEGFQNVMCIMYMRMCVHMTNPRTVYLVGTLRGVMAIYRCEVSKYILKL
jgi:hypothetical protein